MMTNINRNANININEGNKLIAKFRGFKIHKVDETHMQYILEGYISESFRIIDGYTSDEMAEAVFNDLISDPNSMVKYHSSWDWLMPVIEQIEKLNYIVKIHQNVCIIQACVMGDNTVISRQVSNYSEDNTKLSNTYNAVIEFIKWYNTNKK